MVLSLLVSNTSIILSASPETALNQANLAEKLLIKLQNNKTDEDFEKLYRYLDIMCYEDTLFFSYKIKELENLMDKYRENIILKSRNLAENKQYQEAVEFLESKSELFKDKTTINSLISHYSKYFIKDGLFYCDISPKIIAINKLIAYPLFAFKDNSNYEELDSNYLTSKEFQNLLNELYSNNYILVNIDDCFEFSDEYILKRDLYLPENKKPVILMFNNATYNEDECFVDKFIIDGKEKIATFSAKQTEKNQISYNADFISILENFIDENKDFSFNNAKAIISFDKSGNILGYNISKNNPNYNNDILQLKKLASFLKDLGYKFAYGNYAENYNNIENCNEEILFITENIFPIFSNINIYISPHNNNCLNNYYKNLSLIGFKIFIDFSNNNFTIKNNLAFCSANLINGNFLRQKSDFLGLNFEKIYDHNNRSKIF